MRSVHHRCLYPDTDFLQLKEVTELLIADGDRRQLQVKKTGKSRTDKHLSIAAIQLLLKD